MDKDGYDDVITLRADGYLDLLLNQRGKFRFRQKIAYIPDLVARGILLGDFQQDGYADIVSVDHSGSLVYIDNDARKFARINIEIADSS